MLHEGWASHNKLGDLAVAAGDSHRRRARVARRAGHRRAAADPGNAEYQRDLSISRTILLSWRAKVT